MRDDLFARSDGFGIMVFRKKVRVRSPVLSVVCFGSSSRQYCVHDFNYYSMCTTYQVCVLNTKGKTQTQTSLDIFFGGLRLQTPPGTQHSRLSCFLFFVFETPTLARACLPVCLSACLPACLPARPPACHLLPLRSLIRALSEEEKHKVAQILRSSGVRASLGVY